MSTTVITDTDTDTEVHDEIVIELGATLPAAGCCEHLPFDSTVNLDVCSLHNLGGTLPAADCCVTPNVIDVCDINSGVTLPAAECCVTPKPQFINDDDFASTRPAAEYRSTPPILGHSHWEEYSPNPYIDCHPPLLPGFWGDGSKGNSYAPTDYIPGLHSLHCADRSLPYHYIGGLRSQMNGESWSHELGFESDVPLREYLFYGIRDGFIIVDPSADIPSYDSPNYITAKSGSSFDFVDNLIKSELLQGKYVRSNNVPKCIHALGAIPKPDGKFRPITDCRRPIGLSINNHMNLTCETFSYNSVDNVCTLLEKGCYMATVDISASYRSISVNPSQWTFQGIRWNFKGEDIMLMDTHICFGGKNSPYLFTQISNFVTRCMTRRGYPNVVNYLDDFMVFGNSWSECQKAQLTLINLLVSLGFEVAWKKCTSPSQQCVYLGIIFDSTTMEISLPEYKLCKLHHELSFFKGRDRATKRQLQRLCGTLAHCSKVVRGGRTFSRRIIDLLCALPDGNPRISLSNEFKLDLQWWTDFAETFNGTACVIVDNYGCGPTIYSDSSLTGYGYVMGAYWQAGYFASNLIPNGLSGTNPSHNHWANFDCSSDNINVLELVPILLACKKFGHSWRNQRVICYSDDTQVVSCLNRGTSINTLSMEMLRSIFWLSATFNFHITARHISGIYNYLPDLLSRLITHNDVPPIFSAVLQWT